MATVVGDRHAMVVGATAAVLVTVVAWRSGRARSSRKVASSTSRSRERSCNGSCLGRINLRVMRTGLGTWECMDLVLLRGPNS